MQSCRRFPLVAAVFVHTLDLRAVNLSEVTSEADALLFPFRSAAYSDCHPNWQQATCKLPESDLCLPSAALAKRAVLSLSTTRPVMRRDEPTSLQLKSTDSLRHLRRNVDYLGACLYLCVCICIYAILPEQSLRAISAHNGLTQGSRDRTEPEAKVPI